MRTNPGGVSNSNYNINDRFPGVPVLTKLHRNIVIPTRGLLLYDLPGVYFNYASNRIRISIESESALALKSNRSMISRIVHCTILTRSPRERDLESRVFQGDRHANINGEYANLAFFLIIKD